MDTANSKVSEFSRNGLHVGLPFGIIWAILSTWLVKTQAGQTGVLTDFFLKLLVGALIGWLLGCIWEYLIGKIIVKRKDSFRFEMNSPISRTFVEGGLRFGIPFAVLMILITTGYSDFSVAKLLFKVVFSGIGYFVTGGVFALVMRQLNATLFPKQP